MEASAPRYIRPFCLTESQSEGDERKRGKWGRIRRKKKSEKSGVIWFFISGCAAGECTHSTSGSVCTVAGGEVGEGNLDVRGMSDKGLACLLGSVAAYFKEGIGVPEVCFAWLKHEQRVLSSEWLICDSPPLSCLVVLPPCLQRSDFDRDSLHTGFSCFSSGCREQLPAHIVDCCLWITYHLSEMYSETRTNFHFEIFVWLLSQYGAFLYLIKATVTSFVCVNLLINWR